MHDTLTRCRGVTLLDLMIVVIVVMMLGVFGTGAYQGYIERARVSKASAEIAALGFEIARFDSLNLRLPNALAELGLDRHRLTDPWGNPYQYLNLSSLNGVNGARKDRNNIQLNHDYDLYSFGPDGPTNAFTGPASQDDPTASQSQDDIVRALSGMYVGTVKNYSSEW